MLNEAFERKILPGSKAYDPIVVLDDDEPDIAEVSYIELEGDNEAPIVGEHPTPSQQAVAGIRGLGFQSVAKSHNPDKNTQRSDPVTHTKRVTQPLFRALTKDDIPAPSVQAALENRSMGFQAWYRTHGAHHTGNKVPGMQQKAKSRKSAIALYNEKGTKNTTRKDRDAPQFEMSVLNSNRKRTIGELGYDELISPAQIESPSEKLARMARKRRHHQERSDILMQNTYAGDAQTGVDLDQTRGHENDRTAGENVDLAVSSIASESLEGQETAARVGDERIGASVVHGVSPVNPDLLDDGQESALPTHSHEDPGDSHKDTSGMCSRQTATQNNDAQEHGKVIRAAYSRDKIFASCKSKRATRISGPTKVCGVFSPEKKPPVKRASHGAFHCPRCDSQFTRSKAVNYHFENCVTKYGNPMSLQWNDHPSLEGVANHVVTKKNEQTDLAATQVPLIEKGLASSNVPIDRQIIPISSPIEKQIGRPPPIANMTALPQDSNSQAPSFSEFPEVRTTTQDQALCSGSELKLDDQKSFVEHVVEHRQTAGKGLSKETLRMFQETGDWTHGMEVDQKADEDEDDETEVPNLAYRYFVQKREWLETEDDAIELDMGPYRTMSEANAVAKAEVQSPQIDEFEGTQSKGWSYLYKQDEYGMQTHMATVLEIHIETAVYRELMPANERVSIPKSAFMVAPHVYIIHELQWLPTSPDVTSTAPTHCQSLTHGVFTLLNKANQRAAAEYLETLTGNWGKSEYDGLKKLEMKSDMDKKVRVLNRENECFWEEIQTDNKGFAQVWVEVAVVEGPRN
ncbi:MAG: hypothetical protein ASARMPRED_007296 [Alectoria sarmentosa]|nr:MAG: hypothetical protein ASARMPRED_007296 [Alectoria sarmentosa]